MAEVEKQHPMDEKSVGAIDGDKHNDGLQEVGSMIPQIDPKKEKILLAKLDLFFTPVIMLVYLSCFLDRSNIVVSQHDNRDQGNVKVAGMPEDVGASAQQFSTAVSIFYGQ